MEQPIIQVQNLTFSFQSHIILNHISFDIEKYRFASFIGPSGCGKTTLLHILTGIYEKYSGRVHVETENISFVFQQESLLEWKTAVDNVLLPYELKNIKKTRELYDKAYTIFRLVGLEGYEYHFPHELSGGMKKRVEIARALITDPTLLVLDEPFSSLDILTREKLNVLIKYIHSVKETTVVLVTHSVEEACFLSEKIFVMSQTPSSIIQIKTIENKKNSNTDMFVLSKEENRVNREIREDARNIWNPEFSATEASVSITSKSLLSSSKTSEPSEPSEASATSEPSAASEENVPSDRKTFRTHYNWFLIPIELVLLYFVVTWIKSGFSIQDFIFPYPKDILSRFFKTLFDGTILPDLKVTVIESLSGFGIAFLLTLLLGYLIAKSKLISNLFMPYIIAANTIPSVALAPFLVLWFGFGITPRIITSVIVIFFPMLMNNISALIYGEEHTRDLVRFYKPGRIKRLLKFELPSSLPIIFTGIKVSITLSVIGAVVGEYISGAKGLGSLVTRAKAAFDVEMMFVGLLWLITLGLLYYSSAHFLYLAITRHYHMQGQSKEKKGANI